MNAWLLDGSVKEGHSLWNKLLEMFRLETFRFPVSDLK